MPDSRITAVLGPTNTGKTHLAVERLCAHSSGMMGFPLRLLAREIYDRVVAAKGAQHVGLLTGEERIMPPGARWLLCTTESMPVDRDVAFVGIDEVQLGSDPERGHIFTDRMLNVRGREETMLLGSASLSPVIRALIPEAEIISRPRFSKLSYAPIKKLSRLPTRSAIVAFSVEEVYAIAESLRQARGGAAVVTGALSPQTRNAQVKLYQDGEVDYLVATDAIGMGLNMDVGHIYFASLTKFDGRRHRRLTLPEMAQIAGRAGRHQRDGEFSTLAGADYFTPEEIDRIEEHKFQRLDYVYWREAEPDFTTIDTLIASLERLPFHVRLRAAPEAIDLQILRLLADDADVRDRLNTSHDVERVWDACRLPDFQKLGPEFHARMIARLHAHLGSRDRVLPDAMIGDQLARLDTVNGDVSTIAARIAVARTWSYVAQRSDWLREPETWRTRWALLETKLSDALHARLTERFVDRRAKMLMRYSGSLRVAQNIDIDEDGAVRVEQQPIGTLIGFRFSPDPAATLVDRKRLIAAAEKHLARELERRAQQLIAANERDITFSMTVGEPVGISWDETRVAVLKPGPSLTAPKIKLDTGILALDAAIVAAIKARLETWVATRISTVFAVFNRLDSLARHETTAPVMRGLLAQIVAAGGIAERAELNDVLAQLSPDQRHQLRKAGLVIGSLDVFHPAMIKPEAAKLRLALSTVRRSEIMLPVPMAGLGLIDRPSPDLASAAIICGFRGFGSQMLRIDLVERIARRVHDQRSGKLPFAPDRQLATSLGISEPTLVFVLRALGFVPAQNADAVMWQWRGRASKARAEPKLPPNPAFAALESLTSRVHR